MASKLAVISAIAHAGDRDALEVAVPAAEAILLRDRDSGRSVDELLPE